MTHYGLTDGQVVTMCNAQLHLQHAFSNVRPDDRLMATARNVEQRILEAEALERLRKPR